MHNYEIAHGRLPPAVVYGKNGQPLYSWRVLLLPYIDADNLYAQFHLDEPWDSPHNRQFVEQMPPTFALPGSKAGKVPPGYTCCHVFVGKGTAFEKPEGMAIADLRGPL